MDLNKIIDDKHSLSNHILRALNVGADREMLHEIMVEEEKTATEEEFFLAFATAEIRLKDLEALPPTVRY